MSINCDTCDFIDPSGPCKTRAPRSIDPLAIPRCAAHTEKVLRARSPCYKCGALTFAAYPLKKGSRPVPLCYMCSGSQRQRASKDRRAAKAAAAASMDAFVTEVLSWDW